MKEWFMMLIRLCLELMLFGALLPFIVFIMFAALMYYIIVFKLNGCTFLEGIQTWLSLIKEGILMNIDFILNGF